MFEFMLWSYGGRVQEMFFFSKNYPRIVVLITLQAHELFFFGKGIDISRFLVANHQYTYWVWQNDKNLCLA